MERRHFLLTGAAGLIFAKATASVAAEPWVADMNTYLNSVKTAFAPFSQVDASGRKASGRFYLQKPGKMRFEYDQKEFPLTVTDGTAIAIFDPKSNAGPQTYPQNTTPVSLISKSNIDLMNTKFVTRMEKNGNEGLITMVDPARPKVGSLILRVDLKNPTIKGWQAIDQAGNKTTVTFPEFHTGVAMNPSLFDIVKIKNSK